MADVINFFFGKCLHTGHGNLDVRVRERARIKIYHDIPERLLQFDRGIGWSDFRWLDCGVGSHGGSINYYYVYLIYYYNIT